MALRRIAVVECVQTLSGRNQCRGAVETTRSRQPDFEAYWKKLREKQKKG